MLNAFTVHPAADKVNQNPLAQLPLSSRRNVSARDLHAFLEVGTAFKDWIVRRTEEYGFIGGQDFCSFLSESSGGRPAREYAITLGMPKKNGREQ